MQSIFGQPKKQPSMSERVSAALDGAASSVEATNFEAQGLLGLRPKTQQEEIAEAYDACCPALSYQQRLIGFGFCVFASFVLALAASFMLGRLIRGEPAPFAIAYTLDNLTVIGGSLFLSGPTAQCAAMWAEKRRVTTAVYLITLGTTLFFAFFDGIPDDARIWCVLASLFVQWVALVWYSLSYIPFVHSYITGKASEYCCGCCAADEETGSLGEAVGLT